MGAHDSQRKRKGRFSPAAFFLLAILLHGALLCLPVRRFHESTQPEALQVDIFLANTPQSRSMDAPRPSSESARPEVETPLPRPETDELEPGIEDPANEPAVVVSDHRFPVHAMSAALLLEQASRLIKPVTDAPVTMPGLPAHRKWPDHLSQPILPPVETLFSQYVLPVANQVVDQWQEPDGTRRVIVRLPNGLTLCGSHQRWDPFNPLFEPVPMFHACGGGGRRSH